MNLIAQIRESRITSTVAKLFMVAAVLGVYTTENVSATDTVNPAIAAARDLSGAFRAATGEVMDAVVAIESRKEEQSATQDQGLPKGENPFKGTPFEDLFNEGRRQQQAVPHRSQTGIGSGVLIHKSGLILTNNHVVDGADHVIVRLHDGREFKAVDVKTDPKTDIAIVRIESDTDFPFAKLGDSDVVEIGDWVLALGQPFGLESTVTAGIISAKHRGIGIAARENFLQTDAAINPGNSGGPLVNLDGKVIGINTAISSSGGGNDGIGFAIPVNMVKWVGKQLVADGKVRRAYLGVGIQPVTAELAKQFHVGPRTGVLINQVHADTPAEKAGLQSGDVIVEFSGKAITDPRELQLLVESADMEKSHSLKVIRDGKSIELSLRPEVLPEDLSAATPTPKDAESDQLEELGLAVQELTPEIATQLGLEGIEGVLIADVRDGSPAQREGLEPGNVITHVNRQQINSKNKLMSELKSDTDEEGVLLFVRTNMGSRYVVLKS
ncbi:Do family serine endopeptidase [Bythopirellula goksoeyrii]|uniref:Putative periplasmic serine endoprotease DegP-like n=1 Tax=Bythopirellula goksoeyrii TaxID=1400387 RepID=A0A5B9QAH3_9BACT|nr:Do family serine endopeptidase [Bythopirellula goksoeyrii]QEG34600.1 putative periplasmic serine endoprotease DegP-like precursor [Bythopirellula goksoeyrii]